MPNPFLRRGWLSLFLTAALGCGGEMPGVTYGETTFVVLVNPVVNDANQMTVADPGGVRSGIAVSVDQGPSGATDGSGVTILRPIVPGGRMLLLTGGGMSGQLGADIAERDLREVAVALQGSGASAMADIVYAFGGQVVEITDSMPIAAINAELARSNLIVFFRSGTYTGDIVFAGSNVTLFGEGPTGGSVTLSGNVEVSGSRNRIRGARILGRLSVPGSDFGMSFSSVAGMAQVAGSGVVLLQNTFCGGVTISGSGGKLLGNAGLAPVPAPGGGC